jgi:hypothetical protein
MQQKASEGKNQKASKKTIDDEEIDSDIADDMDVDEQQMDKANKKGI